MTRLLLVLSALAMFSCGGTATPSLAEIQSTIFTPKCATAGCHVSGAAAAQGLDLSSASYAKLVGVSSTLITTKKLVVAGDPTTSFLYEKVSAASPTAGTRMPLAAPLSASDVELIRAWIAAGAPNN